MGTHNRTIRHHALHIGVIAEIVKHLVENTMVTPAREPFVNAIPFAVFLRQQAPLRPASEHPQGGFDETTAGSFLPHVYTRMVTQKVDDLVPLVIS